MKENKLPFGLDSHWRETFPIPESLENPKFIDWIRNLTIEQQTYVKNEIVQEEKRRLRIGEERPYTIGELRAWRALRQLGSEVSQMRDEELEEVFLEDKLNIDSTKTIIIPFPKKEN